MLHTFTLQPNESLNMRAAELAPEYKNYSRSISLTLRISLISAHQNCGFKKFYFSLFSGLGMHVHENVKEWLALCKNRKQRKKELDSNPTHEMVHKYQSKSSIK